MRPNLVVWDWNGTILDDMEFTYDIENIMLKRRGMTAIPSKEFYLSNFGFPIIDYYVKLGYDFRIHPYEQLAEEFHQLYTESYQTCSLREGVLDALKKVQELGIPQTILSASNQTRLVEQTDHYGVSGYFEELLGLSDDFAHSKADRAKQYIERMHLDPETVLFIGDTDHDYEVATAAGCRCVLLTGGHQGRDVLLKCGVPVMDSPTEILSFITE